MLSSRPKIDRFLANPLTQEEAELLVVYLNKNHNPISSNPEYGWELFFASVIDYPCIRMAEGGAPKIVRYRSPGYYSSYINRNYNYYEADLSIILDYFNKNFPEKYRYNSDQMCIMFADKDLLKTLIQEAKLAASQELVANLKDAIQNTIFAPAFPSSAPQVEIPEQNRSGHSKQELVADLADAMQNTLGMTSPVELVTPEAPLASISFLPQPAKRLNALAQYPKDELYRLVLDNRLHTKRIDLNDFNERHPGILKAAFDGLALAIADLKSTQLTLEYIQRLHKACTTNIAVNNGAPGELRSHPMEHIVGFTIQPEYVTEAGVHELLNMIASQNRFPRYHSAWIGVTQGAGSMDFETAIYQQSLDTMRAHYGVPNNEMLAKHLYPAIKAGTYSYLAPRAGSVFTDELKKTIDHYNLSILHATDDESKLAVIVDVIYDLHHLHLFLDANTRTLIILLLNRILIQNGFVPATFDNIHCFVGHSKQELVIALKQAMQNTLDLVSGKKRCF